jgi:protein ImuA
MVDRLAELRERLRRAAEPPVAAWETVPSGRASLDALLRDGGFRRGTLVEWFAEAPGSGATTLALVAARQAADQARPVVVVDRSGQFCPSAVVSSTGVGRFGPRQLLVVRSPQLREARWACDQALRTPGVGAVVAWMEEEDERWLRRWQLAAEASGALGLVVRHMRRPPEACFSNVRLRVEPLPGESCAVGERRVRVEVLRRRQGGTGTVAEVSLYDEARVVSEVPARERRRTLIA